ncbi:MAG: hypothetical protein RQ875_01520 [Vicingaceae bacterium]|nr:hypothetical protein [Vicingaceae bacterium]
MNQITIFNYLALSKEEEQLKLLLFNDKKPVKRNSPKKSTINNILNYSKALSVRDSNHLETVSFVLN